MLAITKGFKDSLRIGYQTRPDLFARKIDLPDLLYNQVIEIDQRHSVSGDVLVELDRDAVYASLKEIYDTGIRACAIVFLHGYRYHEHEKAVAEIAHKIGYTQISTSHEVSPLMKLIGRGDTTVVDAYLSPVLKHYVNQIASELNGVRLMFMQSNGGLTDAGQFQGKDSILSGLREVSSARLKPARLPISTRLFLSTWVAPRLMFRIMRDRMSVPTIPLWPESESGRPSCEFIPLQPEAVQSSNSTD